MRIEVYHVSQGARRGEIEAALLWAKYAVGKLTYLANSDYVKKKATGNHSRSADEKDKKA